MKNSEEIRITSLKIKTMNKITAAFYSMFLHIAVFFLGYKKRFASPVNKLLHKNPILSMLNINETSKPYKNYNKHSDFKSNEVSIVMCEFVQCSSERGGAAYVETTKFVCKDSRFVLCEAKQGGGISALATTSEIMKSCFFRCSAELRYHSFFVSRTEKSDFNYSVMSCTNKPRTQYVCYLENGEQTVNYINTTHNRINYFGSLCAMSKPSPTSKISFCNIYNTSTMSFVHFIASVTNRTKPLKITNCSITNNRFFSVPISAVEPENSKEGKLLLTYCVYAKNRIEYVSTIRLSSLKITIVNCYFDSDANSIFNCTVIVQVRKEEIFQIFTQTINDGGCQSVRTLEQASNESKTIPKGLIIGASIAIVLIIVVSIIIYIVYERNDKKRYNKWISSHDVISESLL